MVKTLACMLEEGNIDEIVAELATRIVSLADRVRVLVSDRMPDGQLMEPSRKKAHNLARNLKQRGYVLAFEDEEGENGSRRFCYVITKIGGLY